VEPPLDDEYYMYGDFMNANNLTTGDPLAVKMLGSKSVNSLRLTEIACGGLFKTPR
jgi:hypothetical protein